LDCGWCLKEAALLSEEVVGLRRQMEDSSERGKTDSDAMFHLQTAQATLKERYAKLQKKNAELQKRLDQTMMKLVLAGRLCVVCNFTHKRFNCNLPIAFLAFLGFVELRKVCEIGGTVKKLHPRKRLQ